MLYVDNELNKMYGWKMKIKRIDETIHEQNKRKKKQTDSEKLNESENVVWKVSVCVRD